MIVTNLEIVKSWIVGGTFVRSADESYITARWCIQTGQNSDFAWLAVHAFEKYMKAVLLMNGKTSKGHGHDIGKIYEAIKLLCNGLLPNSLQKESTTPETYLNSLYSIGHPDARYGLFDSNVRLDDLNNLDRMVYIIRRLICPLDQKIDEVGNMPSDSIPTYRDWLGANANDCLSIGGLLGKVIKDKTSPLRVPALNCNLAFSPADFGHDHDWENSAWRKSNSWAWS